MKVKYINSRNPYAWQEVSHILTTNLWKYGKNKNPIVLLCIGTDRVTGDCLGPITGYKFQQNLDLSDQIFIYGTLNEPVHAKNLPPTIQNIYRKHENPLVIAIDSSLGKTEHIGYITIGEGPLHPGAGMGKSLPSVGDICITGIVNFSGMMDYVVLQNTRLQLVMQMSDVIYEGVRNSLITPVQQYSRQTREAFVVPRK